MDLFKFNSYIKYLQECLTDHGKRAGAKAALAKHLRCQSSFVSQVLAGRCHLSLEHAILVSDFFKHSDDERDYFLLLVQWEKSGSARLRNYFQNQIELIQAKRNEISKRVSSRDQVQEAIMPLYYSMWWYAAIHILTGLPGFQTIPAISRKLALPADLVAGVLDKLVAAGLVEQRRDTFTIGKKRIHLDQKSTFIHRHHINWRAKSMQQCEIATSESLRYSGILALSEEDAIKVKELILDLVEKSERILKTSQEEDAFILLCDFFRL